ncbi:MAG: adenylate/guanylate cyclase domain-containing protein [Chloroflexi bacterium]|nr:adenylate/guanylate cyclase domain-containing protein [Chloroflexota bacterium]
MTRRQRRRIVLTATFVLAVSVLLSALFSNGQFAVTSQRLTDVFFENQQSRPATSKNVVIVAIDDKSVVALRRFGRVFVWPRWLYADVVRHLADARARTIAFDMLFDAPGEGDPEFVEAMRAAGERATWVVLASAGDYLSHREAGRGHWERYSDVFEPREVFAEVARGVGMANQLPDPDGTIRRVPLVFDVDGAPYPSLPLVAVSRFLRRPDAWDGPIADNAIPLAGREIPIDTQGTLIVNYAGGPYKSSPPAFPVLSFVDVANGNFDPEAIRGKLVLVGVTATGFADDFWTPPSVLGKMDGVEIHANVVDTILRTEFLHDAPAWVTIALMVGFAIVAATTLSVLPTLVAALVCLLVLGGYAVAASTSFDNGGLILNLVYPPLALGLTFAVVVVYRVIFEQAQSRALRGVLGQYLSPSVVAEVTRDPERLKLGGDQREMTVLFSDIRGFTTVSERLDPESLVHLLNQYLTAMSDVIFRHEGTIDKYMGDAIMAFWGAPQRQPDHAELACRAALEMVSALEQLNEAWASQGQPPLRMGIGVNTGTMKVGNMGSNSRFDYTVMGDAVNLGSRLEGLNKEYGTTLIVSKATLDETSGQLHVRFLDLVAVKGKQAPVEIFEIVDAATIASIHGGPALQAYEEGIAAYRRRDWLGAAARFQEALRLSPADGPSAVYLRRCEELLADPPPADWDGVFVMTHK